MGPFIFIILIAIVIVIICYAVKHSKGSEDVSPDPQTPTTSFQKRFLASESKEPPQPSHPAKTEKETTQPSTRKPKSFPDYLPGWNKSVHSNADQIERQHRAIELLPSIISIDYEEQTALVRGDKDGIVYEASTTDCTCEDFTYRRFPCKHMYCLAMRLYQNDFPDKENAAIRLKKLGSVTAKTLSVKSIPAKYHGRFIAFDTETTGLSPTRDRIVELAAVIFENGEVINSFSSLVNPRVPMPQAATNVNHITSAMVRSAPSEQKVYSEFVEFLGDAVQAKSFIVAHNARFDKDFLVLALKRLGFDADLLFVDTLELSKKFFPGYSNYKQQTIANNLGLINKNAHRAESDAEICGKIFLKILPSIIPPTPEPQEAKTMEEVIHNSPQEIKTEPKKERTPTEQKHKSATHHHGKHAIYQLNDNNEVIEKFESIADAVNKTSINSKSIRDAASGKQKHAGGYVWRYSEDHETISVK